jgi:chromosomal replication initiation ATPase DnaA
VRLGDTRTPPTPVIPHERCKAPTPILMIELETVLLEPIKTVKPAVAQGITISKIPPRQSAIIMQDVAERHGLTVDDIKSPSRVHRIVVARQETYYLLREAGYSYPQIGRFCGGRDHSSALHGTLKHEVKLKGAKP